MGDGRFETTPPRIYTIDAGRPFLLDLARGLLNRFPDPLEIAAAVIFLPSRRAARAFGDAFLEATGGRATLLPRIQGLGEGGDEALGDILAPQPAPALSLLERRLALARFVGAAKDVGFDASGLAGALAGADSLAGLLDSLYAEEVDPRRLADAAPGEFAEHWARAYGFIRLVAELWPAHLESIDADDPSRARYAALDREARQLAAAPPPYPVVVAGSTGSAPAARRLMAAAARAPKGAVVLPGLDRALAADPAGWSAIDDSHPQAGLKRFLVGEGADPAAIRPFTEAPPPPRGRLLSVALRPAEATDDWRVRLDDVAGRDQGLAPALDGLRLVEARDEDREAAAIAIAFRQILATPHETALLVTPDRRLARRVAAKMRRWSVEMPDSGLQPLSDAPCGVFLRLLADVYAAPEDASAALATLRHPLAGLGLDAADRARATDAFDAACRGVAPATAAGGLTAKIVKGGAEAHAALRALAAPALFRAEASQSFQSLLEVFIEAAERVAASASESGAARLWRGADGAATSTLLRDVLDAAESVVDVTPAEFPAALASILEASVAPASARRARIAALGVLEARLHTADLVILAGLNEGVWPGEVGADPFLSRAMRRALGLPAPERGIGLAAHDFAMLAAAPRVLLTRAARQDGAPTTPSRWLVRLKNILKAAGAEQAVDATARFEAGAAALDAAGPPRSVSPPRPTPPLEARPRRLPVTQIETLLRDPYAIYAQHVLRLRPLDAPGGRPEPRHLGDVLHAAFEAFIAAGVDPDTDRAGAFLAETIERLAPAHGFGPAAWVLLRPEIETSVASFLACERARRRDGAPALWEKPGLTLIDLPGGPFELSARVDRIDLAPDGAAIIYDYKSRQIPSKEEAEAFRSQLALTAFIVERGGFEAIGQRRVSAFAYLQALTRAPKARETRFADEDARRVIDQTAERALDLLADYDRPDVPYLSQPRPKFASAYGDYDLLARRREWSVDLESEG